MKYFPTYDEDNHLWGLVILPRFRKKKKKNPPAFRKGSAHY